MPERAQTRPQRRLLITIYLSFLVLWTLTSCTRDEVAGAVSTVVFDLQATLEPANLTSVAIRQGALPVVPTPTTAALAVVVQPTETAVPVASSTTEPIAPAPTELPPTVAPTAVATELPPPAPTDAPTVAPTLPPSPVPSPTQAPTAIPSPTTLPERIAQGDAELLLVPGSFFKRGADSGELLEECSAFRPGCQAAWFAASQPAHTVLVAPFYIDEHEVTNLSFVTFLNNAADIPTLCGDLPCLDFEHTAITETVDAGFQIEAELANHPVTGITWAGAAVYCEQRGARLPTESEWEKAALWNPVDELKTRYPWGDEFDGTFVNFCDASCDAEQRNTDFDDGYPGTAPVASYENGRSHIGAYDMAGNVWEWVADWYAEDAYMVMDTVNPQGPAAGTSKVVRGGSWFDTGNFTSGLIRFPSPPDNADSTIGFRCAASVP